MLDVRYLHLLKAMEDHINYRRNTKINLLCSFNWRRMSWQWLKLWRKMAERIRYIRYHGFGDLFRSIALTKFKVFQSNCLNQLNACTKRTHWSMLPLNEFHNDQTFVSKKLWKKAFYNIWSVSTSDMLCLWYYANDELPKYSPERNKTKSGEIQYFEGNQNLFIL